MKFKDLLEQRVKSIRKAGWNPTARLEFHFPEGGGVGPWLRLVDPPSQESMGTGPQQIAMWDAEDDADDWEPFETPVECAQCKRQVAVVDGATVEPMWVKAEEGLKATVLCRECGEKAE